MCLGEGTSDHLQVCVRSASPCTGVEVSSLLKPSCSLMLLGLVHTRGKGTSPERFFRFIFKKVKSAVEPGLPGAGLPDVSSPQAAHRGPHAGKEVSFFREVPGPQRLQVFLSLALLHGSFLWARKLGISKIETGNGPSVRNTLKWKKIL